MVAAGSDLVTYLTDAVDARPEAGDGLHVGDRVLLRSRADGRAVEAWSPSLGRLGRLPAEDGEALAPRLNAGGAAPVVARVTALVPRPGRPGGARIHLSVPVPDSAG